MKTHWRHKSVLQLISNYQEQYGTDPVEIIRSLACDLVLQAFTKGWGGPPFNIVELCKMLDFEVLPSDLVVDARISVRQNGKYLVEYNPFLSPNRINFSLAHEIGHSLFSDCGETMRYRAKGLESNSWELEFLCNIAAAEILLPYSVFYKDANSVQLTIDRLSALSEAYAASLESVFIRFCEVVDKPCMILLCQFDEKDELHVQYAVSSKSCRLQKPNLRYLIPKSSKAYECIKAGWTSHQMEGWELFGKEQCRVFSVGLPPVRKHTEPRVGILIVPDQWNTLPPSRIYTVKGDATIPRGDGNKIIVQIVNTNGGLGAGFGKAMATKYPLSREAISTWKKNKKEFRLGHTRLVQLEPNLWVFQILAQDGIYPRYGQIPLKYDSLQRGLQLLAKSAVELQASVHMPMIGTGQAHGDWDIIQGIVYQELTQNNIDVTVYILPRRNNQLAENSSPTLFSDIDNAQ